MGTHAEGKVADVERRRVLEAGVGLGIAIFTPLRGTVLGKNNRVKFQWFLAFHILKN